MGSNKGASGRKRLVLLGYLLLNQTGKCRELPLLESVHKAGIGEQGLFFPPFCSISVRNGTMRLPFLDRAKSYCADSYGF